MNWRLPAESSSVATTVVPSARYTVPIESDNPPVAGLDAVNVQVPDDGTVNRNQSLSPGVSIEPDTGESTDVHEQYDTVDDPQSSPDDTATTCDWAAACDTEIICITPTPDEAAVNVTVAVRAAVVVFG